jgi:hypothetical protein
MRKDAPHDEQRRSMRCMFGCCFKEFLLTGDGKGHGRTLRQLCKTPEEPWVFPIEGPVPGRKAVGLDRPVFAPR